MPVSAPLRRTAAILGLLALSSVVAAFATIAPREEPAPAARLVVEPLELDAQELAGPAYYVREEQFQRGDTLAGFLGRLGIDAGEASRLARTRCWPMLAGYISRIGKSITWVKSISLKKSRYWLG